METGFIVNEFGKLNENFLRDRNNQITVDTKKCVESPEDRPRGHLDLRIRKDGWGLLVN